MKKEHSRRSKLAVIALSLVVMLAYAAPPTFAASTAAINLSGAKPNERVDVYKVAEIDKEGNVTSYTSDFASVGKTLPKDLTEPASIEYEPGDIEIASLVDPTTEWAAAADTIAAYIKTQQANGTPVKPVASLTTDGSGKLTIPRLEDGRYLVIAQPVSVTNEETGMTTISSHLPTMVNVKGLNRPIYMSGKYQEREVPSEGAVTSRTVQKVWRGDDEITDENGKPVQVRPTSIRVRLMEGKISESGGETWSYYGDPVTLSAANGWSYAWTKLDMASEWDIAEISVPDGYDSFVMDDGVAFRVTNTYRPPKPDEPGDEAKDIQQV